MRLGINRSSGMQRASLMSAVVVFAASLFSVAPAVAQAATTWVVNGSDPDCDDFGDGNEAEPLCTMVRASIEAGPGDTVRVHPGTYREQVHPASGTAGAPVRFEATGPGVRIVGSRDVSDPAQWTQFAGDVWSRPYANPSGQPQMMFADDTLLTKTDAVTLGTDEWFWDNAARVLYANTGGGNPGTGNTIEVGALSFGFQLGGKTHVVVDGFELSRQNFHAVNIGPSAGVPAGTLLATNLSVEETGSYGINVDDANSGNIDVVGNEVTRAGSHGIRLRNASNIDVLGNISHDNLNSGFAVHAASGNRLIANTAYGNARPLIRSANGIDVNNGVANGVTLGSSNNVFRNNLLYDNQDSGLQVYNGSNNNVVVRNISHGNGDHGLDTLRSTGTRYISNTSYGNFLDGISIEGMSTGTRVFNNISVDNGIGREGFDLYVDDDGSVSGFVSDYNLLWKSAPGVVIKVDNDEYSSIAAFAQATPHEDHGVGGNPRFVNPAAGNFHLLSGSPAIDSANAGAPGFQLADLEGRLPMDDGTVANIGAGSPPYADRGALEFDAPDTIPPDTTITTGPAEREVVNSTDASFEFTSNEPGSTFECKLDAGAWQQDCTSPRNYSGLADGPHTFSVRATDAANNTDQSPATRNWTVDTTAPNTTIDAGPVDGSSTNSTSARFEFSSTENGSTFECNLDNGGWQGCTSPRNNPALEDGPHTFSVRATDGVGNRDQTPATRSWTVDIAIPNTTIAAGPRNRSSTNSTSARFAFTSNKAGRFECELDAGGWQDCTSPKNYSELSDGTHTFSVRAIDDVGNTDPTPGSRSWSVDTKAPNTKITKKPKSTVTARTARFAFKSTESDSTFRCKRDDRKWRKCTSPKVYKKFSSGRRVFKVKAIDAHGNVDRTVARYVWRILKRK